MLKYTHDSSGNIVSQTVVNALLPQIMGQPVKQVAALGDIASFSVVVAEARAVTFQWKFNDADIPGATGDSLLLTDVNTANEGQYSVVVTNGVGSVTSDPVALVLRRNPTVNSSNPPRLIVYSDEGGSVTVTPMKTSYNLGETVTLTATPFEDCVFVDWMGNVNTWAGHASTIANPVTLRLNGNKTVRARFASALLRLSASSDAGGSVTFTPKKLGYALGETVTLTAMPFPPSAFVDWAKDLSGNANPATLTMDRNKTVRARFTSAVPPGLIALWRGDTDASDLIGGHHGTFFHEMDVTAPSVTALGKVGGAFNFDGTLWLRVPDSAALQPTQFTAEAWVFPTAPSDGPRTIMARGFYANTWDLRLISNMPQFWSHGGQALSGPTAIPLNEWTHLAITFDGLIKRLYVNGAQVAWRNELRALVYDAAPVPLTIGSDFESNRSGNHFNGRIDEIALYNRALTPDEVLGIYNADFLGKNFSQPYFTSPAQLPDGVLGANYAQQLTTIPGTLPVSFSVAEGLLPPGMNLSVAGVIGGIPAASGTFGFTARATDAAGAFTEQLCMLRVL